MAELKERIIGFEIFGLPHFDPNIHPVVRVTAVRCASGFPITTMTPPMMGMGDRASPRSYVPVFRAPEPAFTPLDTTPESPARDSVSTLQAVARRRRWLMPALW